VGSDHQDTGNLIFIRHAPILRGAMTGGPAAVAPAKHVTASTRAPRTVC
jgi:hypothetical protein